MKRNIQLSLATVTQESKQRSIQKVKMQDIVTEEARTPDKLCTDVPNSWKKRAQPKK